MKDEQDDLSYVSIKIHSKKKQRRDRRRRIVKIICIVICILFPIIFILIFVVFPVVFMHSPGLQRLIIFTHFGLPEDRTYFETYKIPGYQNNYVTVKDRNDQSNVTLGYWHLLPVELTYQAFHNPDFDYENALRNSNYRVLLYFHGTGEARSYNTRKYELLRYYFHVIVFDYRSYADSTRATLSEDAVVKDCVQVYEWLANKTSSPIYVWGHSIGSALATRTVATLRSSLNLQPEALILESAFTSMREEIKVHPFGKVFAWLPWFNPTILEPLRKNGFIFNTAEHILNVSTPIMILHAEDDETVPVRFGRKLYEIAKSRPPATSNRTVYFQFDYDLGYNHNYIYTDPFLQYYLRDFLDDNEFKFAKIEPLTSIMFKNKPLH